MQIWETHALYTVDIGRKVCLVRTKMTKGRKMKAAAEELTMEVCSTIYSQKIAKSDSGLVITPSSKCSAFLSKYTQENCKRKETF